MNFAKKYSAIIGMLILIAIVVLLLSPSALFFSTGVSFIDTALRGYSGSEVYVRTKMDIGSNEHMENFPLQIQDWYGVKYDSSDWKELLDPDAGVSLGYTRPDLYPQIFLVILQSESDSSFHPPDVCYEGQGYRIEEKEDESVIIEESNWMKDNQALTVPLTKLVVYREIKDINTGESVIDDRRLVLYSYVRGNYYTSDTVTMIRVSTIIPSEGSYDDYLYQEKQLFTDILPLMFEPVEKEDWHPVVKEIADWGIGGYFLIVFLITIPVGIIVFPKTRWGRDGEAPGGNNNGV